MHEAKTHFSKLALEVEAGQEVLIARSGKPFMKLVPLIPSDTPRQLGFAKGIISDFEWGLWESLDVEAGKLFRDA